METVPEDFEEYGGMSVISNFDHEIEPDPETEKYLKENRAYGNYTAWNFHGRVWFDDIFKCQVKQYQHHVATITGNNLKEIIKNVSERFGWE